MVKWSALSTLTMLNPRSSPLPICQNQCHLWRNHAHPWGISTRVSLTNLPNRVPLLRTEV